MAGPRRFDHDEAVRRYATGEPLSALAVEFGVTKGAVYRVVRFAADPDYRDLVNTRKRVWRTTVCEMCGGPAMRVAEGKVREGHDGRIVCVRCRGLLRRRRYRFDADGALISVRCAMNDCANGDRWQPPKNFTSGQRGRDLRANGIHGTCRACETSMRKKSRESRRVPCEGCGQPTSPADSPDRRDTGRALCHSCSVARPLSLHHHTTGRLAASPDRGGPHTYDKEDEMRGNRSETTYVVSEGVGLFRKRPVVIEAVQWNGQNRADIVAFVGESLDEAWSVGGYCFINTLEGRMDAACGDWIIRGVKGEFYPCKPDIFEATYEPAEPE